MMEAHYSTSSRAFGASELVEVTDGADAPPPSFKEGCSPDPGAALVSGTVFGEGPGG